MGTRRASIQFPEYKSISALYEHKRPILKAVWLDEEEDPYNVPDYLLTQFDEDTQTIIKSARYSNKDVREYGWEKVRSWIASDRERFSEWGETWWQVLVRAHATFVIPRNNGQGFFSQTVDSPGCGGVDSDWNERLDEVGGNELSELKDILNILNVVVPEALKGALGGDF